MRDNSYYLINMRAGRDEADTEKNCCTVFALSNATSCTYAQARQLLEYAGRKDGRRFNLSTFLDKRESRNMQIFGYWVKKVLNFPRGRGPTVNRISQQYTKGKYIILVAGHAIAMVDGKVYDNIPFARPRARVIKMYEFTNAQ